MKHRRASSFVPSAVYVALMACMALPLGETLRAVPQFGCILSFDPVPTLAFTLAVTALSVLAAWGYAILITRSGMVWLHAAALVSSMITALLLMAMCALTLHLSGSWLDWFYQVYQPGGTYIDLFGREPRYALFWCLVGATWTVLSCVSVLPQIKGALFRWIRRIFVGQLVCAVACGIAALVVGGLPAFVAHWQYSGAACALAISGTLVGVLSGSAVFLYRSRAVSKNGKQSPQ